MADAFNIKAEQIKYHNIYIIDQYQYQMVTLSFHNFVLYHLNEKRRRKKMFLYLLKNLLKNIVYIYIRDPYKISGSSSSF